MLKLSAKHGHQQKLFNEFDMSNMFLKGIEVVTVRTSQGLIRETDPAGEIC